MLDLCTLGTGGAIPLPDRALSSLYVRVNGKALMIDCGEGTQTQLRRLGWGFKCVEAVLITHYHADHCGGLPGFLLSMSKTDREEPLHIYGPVGLHRIMDAIRVIAPQLSYPIQLHELSMDTETFQVIGLQVTSFSLDHGMPCLGYDFHLHRVPAFDAAKARALNIPLPLWSKLQAGQTVTADGYTFTPEQVRGHEKKGLHFLYATDTRPVPQIAELGQGADLMILEGMYGEDDKLPQALRNHHMMYKEAAALARDAGTRQLLLTHFSNCIEDPQVFLPSAQQVFADTQVAQDLFTLSLQYEGR